MKEYELYPGASVMVDYRAQNNQDIIDYFEELSMFEGWSTLASIDEDKGEFTIAEMPMDVMSVEYLVLLNHETQEYEFYDKEER